MQVAICQASSLCSLSSTIIPSKGRRSPSAWKPLFVQKRFVRQSKRPSSFPSPLPFIAAAETAADLAMESGKWVSFPFLSSSGKRLMEDIAGTMASELASCLNTTWTPADVRHFKNSQGNGEGSVTLRSGKAGSAIHIILHTLHLNFQSLIRNSAVDSFWQREVKALDEGE
ncbi:hypothetical protein L7F22_065331 [Adiantum nelumboides]|nr:hypothetical protein [Adiantum nelumboides]